MVWEVLPWKLPWKTMIPRFPVACRASLMLASMASAPLLEKKKVSIFFGVIWSNFLDNSAETGGMTMFIWPKIRERLCSWIASTILGWQWPVFVTPIPLVKSVYWLPLESVETNFLLKIEGLFCWGDASGFWLVAFPSLSHLVKYLSVLAKGFFGNILVKQSN